MSMEYPMLFSPIRIGSLEIKNRIALAPMANYMSDDDGAMTKDQAAFLVRRAKGGAGLLIVGSMYVQHPIARFGVGQLGIYDDKLVLGYCEMVKRVHAEGAKIAAQLHHAGRLTTRAEIHGQQPVAPSPIALGVGKYVDAPRELSKMEIAQLVQMYADSAGRCLEAGFDGIEIHMAHGYLPNQFLSPFSNQRSDEYGGDLEGRLRFPREIIQAVKAAVGNGVPVWCRIVGEELHGEAGLRLEDMKMIAPLLVEAGAEALSVSRDTGQYYYNAMNYRFPQGFMVHLAEAIKRVVQVPVFTVGSILEPAFAEEVLGEGRADIIALARAMVCDPDWPNKAAAGAEEDIRPCLRCNAGCRGPRRPVRQTQCVSNAEVGREGDFDITPAPVLKKVLVVGSGPAGLEFARVARQRGHAVTLAEQHSYLGGLLHLGCTPPHKEGLAHLITWWTRQLEKAGVAIALGKQVTADDIRGMHPDVVLVATGGKPIVPSIPGIDRPFVVTANELLAGVTVGDNVLIIGGGQTGAETAEVLVLRGKKVTIVEMLDDIATNVQIDVQYFIKQSLAEHGVRVLTSTVVKGIGDHSVTLTRNGGADDLVWTAVLAPIDSVVLAAGIKPDRALADAIVGLAPEVYVAGDADTPGNVMAAVHRAAILARTI